VRPLGKTVSSAYSPDTLPGGVIQRVVFTEHKRNLSRAGFWFDSERVLHQYTNEAPFCLTKLQVLQKIFFVEFEFFFIFLLQKNTCN
jgi:hypothetical protein